MDTTYFLPTRVVTEFHDRNLGHRVFDFEAGEHVPASYAEAVALARLCDHGHATEVEDLDDPDTDDANDFDPEEGEDE